MFAPWLVAGALGAEPESGAPAEAPPGIHIVRALVQTRYQETSVAVSPQVVALLNAQYGSQSVTDDAVRTLRDTARASDGLSLRRAWLEMEAHANQYLSAEMRLDFATLLHSEPVGDHHGGSGATHDFVEVFAAELEPYRGFGLTLGLLETPFSLFELVHDPEFELAEMGPTHELTEHLGYAGSDIGGIARYAPIDGSDRLELYGGMVGGGAKGAQNYRGPGLLVAQILGKPFAALQLGAQAAWRPRPVDGWSEEYRFRYRAYERGTAYATDATLSLGDVVVRGEWLTGDRTDNDVAVPLLLRRGDARTFAAAWGMAALKIPLGGVTLMPAARAEWLDTDREHDDVGGIISFSGALNVDFSDRVRLLWDLSQRYVQPGTRNWEFVIVRYDADALTGTVQVQLKL